MGFGNFEIFKEFAMTDHDTKRRPVRSGMNWIAYYGSVI